MGKTKTVHTSRTIMFAEISKIMNFTIHDNNFFDSLNQNVINKKTKSGITKTNSYLKALYGFDTNDPSFKSFQYFWQTVDEKDKPMLTLIYAINNDDMLAESIFVLEHTRIGEKANIELFEEIIEKYHPNQYSTNTLRSAAQNIASSWKQAGFILGKVKNIRTQPEISYTVVAFALFLAFLNGDRGDFILNNKCVKALCLSQSTIRELAVESAKRDLLQYNYAGNVTSISFNNLIKKLEINVV